METVFFGRLLLIFLGLYAYEKAVQRWDPLLRMPWAWGESKPKARKKTRRKQNHLKVVK
jgi:hypothetical protein